MNARTKLIAKSLTVRDIITVCYTVNVQHLSYRLVRTHKLSPADAGERPAVCGNHQNPSQPMREWFISKLARSKYEVKTGWPRSKRLLFWMTAAQTP